MPARRKQVVYLFKVADGVCPKSHGMSVALTAGIQQAIVDQAYKAAESFEANSFLTSFGGRKQAIRKLCALLQRSSIGNETQPTLDMLLRIQSHMEQLKLSTEQAS